MFIVFYCRQVARLQLQIYESLYKRRGQATGVEEALESLNADLINITMVTVTTAIEEFQNSIRTRNHYSSNINFFVHFVHSV